LRFLPSIGYQFAGPVIARLVVFRDDCPHARETLRPSRYADRRVIYVQQQVRLALFQAEPSANRFRNQDPARFLNPYRYHRHIAILDTILMDRLPVLSDPIETTQEVPFWLSAPQADTLRIYRLPRWKDLKDRLDAGGAQRLRAAKRHMASPSIRLKGN